MYSQFRLQQRHKDRSVAVNHIADSLFDCRIGVEGSLNLSCFLLDKY